jgi:hypothetical protein
MTSVNLDLLRETLVNILMIASGIAFVSLLVVICFIVWIVRLKKKIRAQEETIKTFTEITTMHNEFYEKVSTILP